MDFIFNVAQYEMPQSLLRPEREPVVALARSTATKMACAARPGRCARDAAREARRKGLKARPARDAPASRAGASGRPRAADRARSGVSWPAGRCHARQRSEKFPLEGMAPFSREQFLSPKSQAAVGVLTED